MQFLKERRKETGREFEYSGMPNVVGKKLLNYAESLREMAHSFDREAEAGESRYCDRRALLEEENVRENCSVIAGHLSELASVLERTAGESLDMRPLEERAVRRLEERFFQEDILMRGSALVPRSEGGIGLAVNLSTEHPGGVDIRVAEEILTEVMGRRYLASYFSDENVTGKPRTYLFVEEPDYMAFTGFARVVKGQEQVSGDNYSFLQTDRGKLMLLLSDGTGSGEKACAESEWVLDLAEKLLESGYDCSAVLRLVNYAAIARGEDKGHPTLDLCKVDLYSGCCDFCKAGGAVSFLKRGKTVQMLEGGKLPLGIFSELESHRKRIFLQEEDCLVMMTDGVLEAFRNRGYEEAVGNIIAQLDCENPRGLAEKLMQLAIFECGGEVPDDMTILTAMLWKNPGADT